MTALILGLALLTPPVSANSTGEQPSLRSAIAGVYARHNDFFEAGWRHFEDEIERLVHQAQEATPALLQLEDSTLFKPTELEQPVDPGEPSSPR